MAIFLSIWLGLCFAGMLVCFFMLARNRWVYAQRTRVLNTMPVTTGLRIYYGLPSYETMLNRFWVWNVADFLSPAARTEWLAVLLSGDQS